MGVGNLFGSSDFSIGESFFLPKSMLYSPASIWWAWNNERAVRALAYGKRGKKEIGVFLYAISITGLEAVLFTYGFGTSHILYGFLACAFPVWYGYSIYLPGEKGIRWCSYGYSALGLLAADFLANDYVGYGTDVSLVMGRITVVFSNFKLIAIFVCFLAFLVCLCAMSRRSAYCKRKHEILYGFIKVTLIVRVGLALLYLFGLWHRVRVPFLDETYYEEILLVGLLIIGDYQASRLREVLPVVLMPASAALPFPTDEVRMKEKTFWREEEGPFSDNWISCLDEASVYNRKDERWETVYAWGMTGFEQRYFGIFLYPDPKRKEIFVLEKTDQPLEQEEDFRVEFWKGTLSRKDCLRAVNEFVKFRCPNFVEKEDFLEYFETQLPKADEFHEQGANADCEDPLSNLLLIATEFHEQ